MSMGGVEVIMPTNHLKDRLPYHNYSTIKPSHNHNHKPNHTRPNRRKRSPVRKSGDDSNNSNTVVVNNKPAKNLTMEQVKILKRGESLNEAKSDKSDEPSSKVGMIDGIDAKATDRLNKMSIADFYAGFGFFDSPPPSSVPLPAFFTKKGSLRDEDPSARLRKILGLDFH